MLLMGLASGCELASLKSRSTLESKIQFNPEGLKGRKRRGRRQSKELKGVSKRSGLRERRKGGERDRWAECNDRWT